MEESVLACTTMFQGCHWKFKVEGVRKHTKAGLMLGGETMLEFSN